MVAETPWLWLRATQRRPACARCTWRNPEALEAAIAERRPLVILTPHMGSFEVDGARLHGALRPRAAGDRAVPPGAPARAARVPGTGAQASDHAHRARQPGRRAPDAARAEEARVGRPAARPGAARRPGRLGAVLRPAGLHDDAGRAAGAADRRALHRAALRAPAARRRLRDPLVASWCGRCPTGTDAAAQVEAATIINETMEQVILSDPGQYLWGYNRYKPPRAAESRRTPRRRNRMNVVARLVLAWLWSLQLAAAGRAGRHRPRPGPAAVGAGRVRASASRCATSS